MTYSYHNTHTLECKRVKQEFSSWNDTPMLTSPQASETAHLRVATVDSCPRCLPQNISAPAARIDRLVLRSSSRSWAAPVHRTTYEHKLPLILVFLNKSGCNLWQLILCGQAATDKQQQPEKSRNKRKCLHNELVNQTVILIQPNTRFWSGQISSLIQLTCTSLKYSRDTLSYLYRYEEDKEWTVELRKICLLKVSLGYII